MIYGYYSEGGSVQATNEDVWTLIEEAVLDAVDCERLESLRVGPMRDLEVSELIDVSDIIDLAQDGRLTPDNVVEVITERAAERIEEGHAYYDSREAKVAFRRIVQEHKNETEGAPALIAWAEEHVSLDPSRYCDGRFPLPLEHVEGEWRFGCRDVEPPPSQGFVTYATEPSPETGHVGWCWWALGKMGDAATLAQAMHAVRQHINKAIYGDGL